MCYWWITREKRDFVGNTFSEEAVEEVIFFGVSSVVSNPDHTKNKNNTLIIYIELQ